MNENQKEASKAPTSPNPAMSRHQESDRSDGTSPIKINLAGIQLDSPKVEIGPELILAIALAGWWSGFFGQALNSEYPRFVSLLNFTISIDVVKLAFVFFSVLWITMLANLAVYWQETLALLVNLDRTLEPSRIPFLYRGINYTYPLVMIILTIFYGLTFWGALDIPAYWILPGPLLLIAWIYNDYVLCIHRGAEKAKRIFSRA